MDKAGRVKPVRFLAVELRLATSESRLSIILYQSWVDTAHLCGA